MKFATMYEREPSKATPAGYRYENMYQEEVGEDGKIGIVKTGVTDIHERIQQDLESTKIENILHAVAMGDLSALNARNAIYTDCTEMPKNLMEAQNLVIKMKTDFYNLPLEVRKEFDNSPEQYVALMGTDEFKNKMKPFEDRMTAIRENEAKSQFNAKVEEQVKFDKAVEAAKGVTE